MRKTFLLLIIMISCLTANAQQDSTTVKKDTTYWKTGLSTGIAFSQLSLTNWSSGGQNSIALNAGLLLSAEYTKKRISWKNKVDLAYGFINQQEDGYKKSDDKINVATEFGYLFSPRPNKIKWTSLIDFKTQFDNGYKYPNDSVRISGFMAPGYLTISTGLEYSPKPHFTILYSPLTGKVTFVNDQRLANAGAFGVTAATYDQNGVLLTEGETVFGEFGTFLRLLYDKEIFKNGKLTSKAEFFTDYLKSFGTIDVNWENKLDMKINSWLSATLILHLIYDKDIKFDKTDANGVVIGTEDKVQFKEFLGIGFKYAVSNREEHK